MNFTHVLNEENVTHRNEQLQQIINDADWTKEVLQFCRAGGFPEEVSASHVSIDDSNVEFLQISFRIYFNLPTLRTCGNKDLTSREVAYALLQINRVEGTDWKIEIEKVD